LQLHYGADYYAVGETRRGPRKQQLWDLMRAASMSTQPISPWSLILRYLAKRTFDIELSPKFGIKPEARVLDVGCGAGDLITVLLRAGIDVTGIELNDAAVADAQLRGLPVRKADLRELIAKRSGKFDVVILSHVLEHVRDPVAFLRDANALMPVGGFLHLALPNGGSPGLTRERDKWPALCYPAHLYHFDLENLRDLLYQCGFSTVSSRQAFLWQDHLRLFCNKQTRAAAIWTGLDVLRLRQRDLLRVVARKETSLGNSTV
jgi:2-polyprenyl-3-methyl-5-hydroxy-6-metoxy-1,4-benzoquinol methylase